MSLQFTHLSGASLDLFERLQAELPEVFTEGKLDCVRLKAFFGEAVETGNERYGLSWAGKSDCFRSIQEKTTKTLKPCREESVNFDETENLFIEGDNLEALKILQGSYYGKVKMIYIDPPYNTGNDFIYNDDFGRGRRDEEVAGGLRSEEGDLMEQSMMSLNDRSKGHFHSNWLNMMYPRLFLARNLLRQDGVIFVSIDDNEVHNLRMMMNEIFGEENFVGQFVWRKKPGGGQADDFFVTEHEYIVVYRRSDAFEWKDEEIPSDESTFNKEDAKGKYVAVKLAKWGNTARKEDRPSMYFPIKDTDGKNAYPIAPDGGDGRWRVGKKRMQELIDNDLIAWAESKGAFIPYEKIYFDESQIKTLKDRSILYEIASTGDGSDILTGLFGKKDLFHNPKPIQLLHFFSRNNTGNNDIILDFFAGSGTTAHAVMQLNAEDGGNRKWVCVQLPELCDEKSEAFKAGYKTIADISKERIRRAGKKIAESLTPALSQRERELDFGFRSLKIDESNFKVWNTQVASAEKLDHQLLDFIDNVQSSATQESLLYELILKSGLPLTTKIVKTQNFASLQDGKLIICLAEKLSKSTFDEILSKKPEKIIVLERAFEENDQLKANVLLQAENAGVKEFLVI